MKKYGNIEGIATLTNNPVAKDVVRGSIGRILAERENAVKSRKSDGVTVIVKPG